MRQKSEPPMNFVKSTLSGGWISKGNCKLDHSMIVADEELANHAGKKIVFGFRPEAACLGSCDGSYVIEGTVEPTELLGDNTSVYVGIDGAKIILKIDPHSTPEICGKITFSVPYSKVYIFEARLSQSLTRGKNPAKSESAMQFPCVGRTHRYKSSS